MEEVYLRKLIRKRKNKKKNQLKFIFVLDYILFVELYQFWGDCLLQKRKKYECNRK